MAKQLALTRRAQFSAVYETGKAFADHVLVVKSRPNGLPSCRLGYSVTKEIGKATVRNHVKRWLKEAVRLMDIQAGWDIVIIARRGITSSSFQEVKESIVRQLKRAGLIESNA